jgi:hypothetical protein
MTLFSGESIRARYFHGAAMIAMLSSAAWPRYGRFHALEIVFSRE